MDHSERTGAAARPWTAWFVVSVATLLLMGAAAPFIARAAVTVLSVEATTPIDWVPRQFGPRRDYEAFAREFESGDVVVVSWPGCELGSPALERELSGWWATLGEDLGDGVVSLASAGLAGGPPPLVVEASHRGVLARLLPGDPEPPAIPLVLAALRDWEPESRDTAGHDPGGVR